MTVETLRQLLHEHADKRVAFLLPSGSPVPLHFHITELGQVTKKFVDCGGVRREDTCAMLQIWVANDTDHVLLASKLGQIMSHASELGIRATDRIECEYKPDHMSIFQLTDYTVNDKALLLQLADKNTACLSPDKCGLDENGNPVCG